jgi:hypothetical protein
MFLIVDGGMGLRTHTNPNCLNPHHDPVGDPAGTVADEVPGQLFLW